MAASRPNGSRVRGLLAAARTSLWPLPLLLFVVVALVAGVLLPRADERIDEDLSPALSSYLFGGDPTAAREVLSAVAGSMITVTSLTFSLTVVTLQLASSQFSPRLLRTFNRDRVVQVTLGIFLATFVFALTVLRTVRSSGAQQGQFVPAMSVTVAFVLAVASVVALVLLLAHLARRIRVETILGSVAEETRATIDRVLEEDTTSEARPTVPVPSTALVVPARSTGFITSVDAGALLAAAQEVGVVVHLDRGVGAWVVAGTPLALAWPEPSMGSAGGAWSAIDLGSLARGLDGAVEVGPERDAVQDFSFGLRQLTDVAAKALSPGINDPTTAVHAIGHIAALLCELTGRDLGPQLVRDEEQRVRVVVPRPDLSDLLDLGIGQLRTYGTGDPVVVAALLQLLRELAWVARREEDRRAVLGQLTRTRRSIGEADYNDTERARLHHLAGQVDDALARRWSLGSPEGRGQRAAASARGGGEG